MRAGGELATPQTEAQGWGKHRPMESPEFRIGVMAYATHPTPSVLGKYWGAHIQHGSGAERAGNGETPFTLCRLRHVAERSLPHWLLAG